MKKEIVPTVNTLNEMISVCWLISGKCNYHCKFCCSQFNDNSISLANAKKIVRKLKKSGIEYVKLSGGEPLLYPHIRELIDYIHKKGMKIDLQTNGSLIDDKMLKFLKRRVYDLSLSLDASNEKIQLRMTRNKGHFNKTKFLLKKIRGSKLRVDIKTLVTKINKNDLMNLGKFLLSYSDNIDYWVLIEFREMSKGKENYKLFKISNVEYRKIKKEILYRFGKKLKIEGLSNQVGHSPYFFIDSSGMAFTIHPKKDENIYVGNAIRDDIPNLLRKIKKIHKPQKVTSLFLHNEL